jgi:hypothetical protein
MKVKRHRLAITVLSFVGLVLLGRGSGASAQPAASLTLDGQAVAGDAVYFSATAVPNSSVRIVVVPAFADVAPASRTAQVYLGCYFGTPTALGTADATTDSSGNVAATLTWAAATAGSYTALLLQGTCVDSGSGGRIAQAASDQQIVALQGFTVADPIPALSTWGFAALGLALSVAGWTFLSRSRS